MATLYRLMDNKVLQNVFIWIFVWTVFIMTVNAADRLATATMLLGYLLVPVYFNNLVVLPLFYQRKTLKGILLFFLNAVLFSGLGALLLGEFVGGYEFRMFFNLSGVMVLTFLFSSALKMARDSILRRRKVREAELKLLKAQLNPHFLFNTLNNLYGLSCIKSDKLPDLMLKLSDLLRYSLYDTREPFVELEKELKYLENYISLERIRLEESVQISFEVELGNLGVKIAPMMLIVFVENAFKHLQTNSAGESFVRIELKTVGTQFKFGCYNSRSNILTGSEDLEQGKSGIGLVNARKRLELIYPGKHDLGILTTKDQFVVQLTLDCA